MHRKPTQSTPTPLYPVLRRNICGWKTSEIQPFSGIFPFLYLLSLILAHIMQREPTQSRYPRFYPVFRRNICGWKTSEVQPSSDVYFHYHEFCFRNQLPIIKPCTDHSHTSERNQSSNHILTDHSEICITPRHLLNILPLPILYVYPVWLGSKVIFVTYHATPPFK